MTMLTNLDRCDKPSCRRRAASEWWWTDAGTRPDRLDFCDVHTAVHADKLTRDGWMRLEDAVIDGPQTLAG